MTIQRTGITYSAEQEYENYTIKGEIIEYLGDSYVVNLEAIENGETVVKFYYSLNNNEYAANYFSEDPIKIKDYQNILFIFMLDALQEVENLNNEL